MKIHHRWVTLARSLRKEEDLLVSRLTPAALKRRYAKGHLALVCRDGDIAAICVLWDVPSDKRWMELGTLWTDPRYREKGLAGRAFHACVETARAQGRDLFLITRKPEIAAFAVGQGWTREERDWPDVPLWKRVCRPWDRYPRNIGKAPKEGILCFLAQRKIRA